MVGFVEVSLTALLPINGLQLIEHFIDKLGSSSCTASKGQVSIQMKELHEKTSRPLKDTEEEI